VKCRKCFKALDFPTTKIGFREVCPYCGIDLHTCTNCRYYSPGKPNDCLVPGTDFVRDREAANFCEDFKIKEDFPEPKPGKKNFDSLFKDEN
jgi:hypothetical protein